MGGLRAPVHRGGNAVGSATTAARRHVVRTAPPKPSRETAHGDRPAAAPARRPRAQARRRSHLQDRGPRITQECEEGARGHRVPARGGREDSARGSRAAEIRSRGIVAPSRQRGDRRRAGSSSPHISEAAARTHLCHPPPWTGRRQGSTGRAGTAQRRRPGRGGAPEEGHEGGEGVDNGVNRLV